MTSPSPTRRRHRSPHGMGVFVTDQELIEFLGIPEKTARAAIAELDRNPRTGFPPKNPLWGDRRYLPAVQKWLDEANGLAKPKQESPRPSVRSL